MNKILLQSITPNLFKSIFLAIAFFCTVAGSAQVSFLGSSAAHVAGNNSKKLIFQHTVVPASNFLIVTVTAQDKHIVSVKFGQQSLTEAITKKKGSMYVAMYYLPQPVAGTDNITVETNNSTDLAAGASNYGNVDLNTPVLQTASSSGSSSAASLVINSGGGYFVVDGIGVVASSVTKAANQILASSAGGSHPNASSYKMITGMNTTTSWTLSNSEDWAMVSVVLKSAPFNSPLPIQLSGFEAKYVKPNVELSWTTEQEINFSHFVIEKSTDGINYTEVSLVFGAGNADTKSTYRYTDKSAGSGGIVYYRLKSIDKDTKSTYSATRVIRLEAAKPGVLITTFPNPVASELKITIPEQWQNQKVTYALYSMNGVRMSNVVAANSRQTETMPVHRINNGIYILVVSCNGEMAQQRIIKH